MIEHAAETWNHLQAMPTEVWLLVYALAAARLTRLVARDAILDRPREWITARTDNTRAALVGYLVNCGWCVGVWVGTAAALALALGHGSPWIEWPIIALAFAQVAGMLTTAKQ